MPSKKSQMLNVIKEFSYLGRSPNMVVSLTLFNLITHRLWKLREHVTTFQSLVEMYENLTYVETYKELTSLKAKTGIQFTINVFYHVVCN